MSKHHYTIVRDPQGNPQELADLLASGGEGEVYPLRAHPEILVKCYHAHDLHQRGSELRQKIEAMTTIKDQFSNLSVCWPRISVFNEQGHWIGYAMRRAQGVRLGLLAHAVLYQKYFSNLDRKAIVGYLIHLLETVECLHTAKVCIGDYNLNNIFCTPNSNQITLIDCDSYQLISQNKVYPCPVGSPDMTPKEHHGKPFKDIERTPESEAFSIAIILFKCLMLGRHPYDILDGNDPVNNLKNGVFPYGKGSSGIPKGPWYNIWSHMPYRLKDKFITTFTIGANDPSSRPTLKEWKDTLSLYLKEIDKGWHEVTIKPAQPKPQSYNG